MLSRRIAIAHLLLLIPFSLPAEDGTWKIQTRESPQGGAPVTLLAQVSGDAISDEYGTQQVNPELQFHCDGGELVARIDWHRFISSFNTELGFQADDGRNKWHKWKVDQSNKITISPSAADTEQIIEKMRAGESLLVDVTPYSESPVQVTFDLAGFAEAIDTFRADCG